MIRDFPKIDMFAAPAIRLASALPVADPIETGVTAPKQPEEQSSKVVSWIVA
jgi:hypothetical protein